MGFKLLNRKESRIKREAIGSSSSCEQEPSLTTVSQGSKTEEQKGLRAFLIKSILYGLIFSLIFFLAYLLFEYFSSYETTDDAFIAGHIIRIAPKVAGHVVGYYIDDNMDVKKGQLLIEIDPRDYQSRVAIAQANKEWAETEWKRMKEILRSSAVSQLQVDAAWAVKLSTEAFLKFYELQLGYTRIYAPEDGRITMRSVEKGQYVEVGQTLFDIVPPDLWVVANYKETQITFMRPGQAAKIRIDAYPHHRYKGHVDSIQRGSGAQFSLLPPENATGNYVKVVQRVPVKILFDEPLASDETVGPGFSVVPTVEVGKFHVSFFWSIVLILTGFGIGVVLAFILKNTKKQR
ncbi:HlyD family secretion protein [Candidatus Methylacidiphilum fumarolicum]|uniref:Multidrug resistance efflux pump n=2 Tax=Candidatus Methylacidiphilum fumarolicum TaxID=591154 RepID=I0K013_METFB|nr:HlyD family secretion protein [Candidatus Methylacidiphilum fumarolicum]MBW6415143.1 HlyD family secretion protein [Candidatus Methylacidiphilum fumarolicum]TFE65977.1 efflux transporter periplasmic adaptor subunit [Candidatus Methylacidiphilum fumarolicum]TFE72708.1 HlyD family secretion protein [Candidatus Methylacidiphilum fumarolicum]TFE73174.1 HlyD family secretion protein [Candidatus Methylacidiphilum fumarolicum]TFE77577.1 efflux transporter periplasmic adaptor subunit [Candidatus Me